jgi:hypothetical protein
MFESSVSYPLVKSVIVHPHKFGLRFGLGGRREAVEKKGAFVIAVVGEVGKWLDADFAELHCRTVS